MRHWRGTLRRKRGEGTWDDFITRHAASLWQCDFLSQRLVTRKGLRDAFVLVFLNVKTRQSIISPATLHPTDDWVVAQAEAFVGPRLEVLEGHTTMC